MIPALIAGLFGPAIDLIKKYVSKDEDATKAIAELQSIQSKMIDALVMQDKQRYELMQAEVSSTNWITSAWRPICSVLFVLIIILSSFGLVHPDARFFDIAQAFLGIYIGGRSGEKIADTVGQVLKGRKG